jgi:uncharacterized damage-inducible protein DinB
MNPTDIYATQLDWARKNINHNLDFIPDDKLNWKPAPAAKSPMEIVAHMTQTIHMFTSALGDGGGSEVGTASNREEAKALISKVVDAHIAKIKSLTPQQMEENVTLPIGEFPKSFIAGAPVIEIIKSPRPVHLHSGIARR